MALVALSCDWFVGTTFVGTYFCSIDCVRVSTSLSSMKALSSAREKAWAIVLNSSKRGQQREQAII